MRARRRTPRRRIAPRFDPDLWDDATLVLLRRDHGCVVCGKPLVDEMERHHRMRRRDGGDRLSNLLGLHSRCHSWVHAHPAEAREQGWIVPTWDNPLMVPVSDHGVLWLLDDAGGRIPAGVVDNPPSV